MLDVPQPIIAGVHGATVGGGLSLSLAADVRIAGTNPKPEKKKTLSCYSMGLETHSYYHPYHRIVGYVLCDVRQTWIDWVRNTVLFLLSIDDLNLPIITFCRCEMGSSYFLPRLIGASFASEILITGNFVDVVHNSHIRMNSRARLIQLRCIITTHVLELGKQSRENGSGFESRPRCTAKGYLSRSRKSDAQSDPAGAEADKGGTRKQLRGWIAETPDRPRRQAADSLSQRP